MNDHFKSQISEPFQESDEFVRLAKAYSWDMKIDEAKKWPYRLLRRVMDIGTFNDMVSIERNFGKEELNHALKTSEVGAMRPKSWAYWHYRLGIVSTDEQCPPLPSRRIA